MPEIKSAALRERNCQRIYGCGEAAAIALNQGLPLRRKGTLAHLYTNHRGTAAYRGIGWEMTFHEWVEIWLGSGHLSERGRGVGRYCMARHGDVGPYRADNVSIKLCTENSREGIEVARPAMRASRKHITSRLGKGRGWTFRAGHKKPYQVLVGSQYIGTFATQADAEAAYRSAVASRHESLSLG